LIPPDDPAALADAIEQLCSGERRKQIAEAGKAIYDQTASAAVRACLIGNAVDQVMGGQWRRQPAHG
jgi:glycosyltransferase involved in cell wall biosynthesis